MDMGHPISGAPFSFNSLNLSKIPLVRPFLPPPDHSHGLPSLPPVDPSISLSVRALVKQRPSKHDVRQQSQMESLGQSDNPVR